MTIVQGHPRARGPVGLRAGVGMVGVELEPAILGPDGVVADRSGLGRRRRRRTVRRTPIGGHVRLRRRSPGHCSCSWSASCRVPCVAARGLRSDQGRDDRLRPPPVVLAAIVLLDSREARPRLAVGADAGRCRGGVGGAEVPPDISDPRSRSASRCRPSTRSRPRAWWALAVVVFLLLGLAVPRRTLVGAPARGRERGGARARREPGTFLFALVTVGSSWSQGGALPGTPHLAPGGADWHQRRGVPLRRDGWRAGWQAHRRVGAVAACPTTYARAARRRDPSRAAAPLGIGWGDFA